MLLRLFIAFIVSDGQQCSVDTITCNFRWRSQVLVAEGWTTAGPVAAQVRETWWRRVV